MASPNGKAIPGVQGAATAPRIPGLKGKYIYWGVGTLLAGLVLGALTMALVNMWLGLIVLIAAVAGGLVFIAAKQKQGLHIKTRPTGIFIHQVNFKNLSRYGRKTSL